MPPPLKISNSAATVLLLLRELTSPHVRTFAHRAQTQKRRGIAPRRLHHFSRSTCAVAVASATCLPRHRAIYLLGCYFRLAEHNTVRRGRQVQPAGCSGEN